MNCLNVFDYFVKLALKGLRRDYILERKRGHAIYHGSEKLSFVTAKLWDLLLNSIKIGRLLTNSKQN